MDERDEIIARLKEENVELNVEIAGLNFMLDKLSNELRSLKEK